MSLTARQMLPTLRCPLARRWRLAAVAYTAGTLALAVATSLRLGSAEGRQLAINVAFILGALVLLISAAARLRTGPRWGRDRWLLATGACWTFGNCWWFYDHQLATSVPSPSTSDVAFLAALVCLGGVVRSYLPATADRSALRRILVDGLLLWLASFTVGWVLFIERALEQGQGMSGLARGVLVAYPVGDVLLLTMVALAMRHGLARDRSVQVLAAALASYVLADFGWNVAAVHGGYEPGSGPFDAGWVLTYGLLAAFPWVTTTHRRADASLRSASFSWSVRPVVLSGAAVLLLLAFSYRGVETADVALVALLVTATSLRHVLLTRDFLGLTQSLEREVAERTADLRTSRDRMRHLALHDSLTGLANRRMLIDRLTDATGPSGTSVRGALLLLDLDDFKTVNDTMGHPMGDRLLVVVAERLKDASRSDDLVARLGGDEFAVLMRDVGPVTAREVAARLLASVHEPVALVPGRRVQPHASLGLAMLQPGLDATDLMVRADLAMYAAKRDGRHSVVMYGPGAHSA